MRNSPVSAIWVPHPSGGRRGDSRKGGMPAPILPRPQLTEPGSLPTIEVPALMPIFALIIDDEQLARDELQYLLDQVGGVEVLAQGTNGIERTVLNASGYVTARRQATVSSKVTGKVAEVLVEEGMKVQEGQVLARIDDTNVKTSLRLAE